MWLEVFITGVVIGISASIPLGPIGVLCIQRTLSKNQRAGFLSGLGAMMADTIFASVAFFSLAIVVSFIEHHMTIIKGVGGACIIAVGINILTKNPVTQIHRNRAGISNLWQDFISAFVLTVANPAFLLVFIAMFAAFGVGSSEGVVDGLITILGVAAGCATWWFVLTFVINLFRKKFRPRHMLWINRIAGTLIIVLGALTIVLMFIKTPVNVIVPS